MSAEFLVLGGSRTGDSFALGERFTIGSDPSCDVRLEGQDIAAFHAVAVRAQSGGYRITVVDGAVDLLVDGSPRRQAHIYHGQRVVVGSVELQFLSAGARDPRSTTADLNVHDLRPLDDPSVPSVERVWKSERFRTAILERGELERLDAQDRALRGLYLLGQATTSERSLARILERTADAVHAALRPDRIIVVLYERPEDRLTPAVVRRGTRDARGMRIPVSQRIVRRAAVEGLSVLTRGPREGDLGERPIACVPLSTRREPVGALYLERLPDGPGFEEKDLDFLGAAGRIAGLAVERAHFEAETRSRTAERDRERARWTAVVHELRSGVLMIDAEGRVELSNPAARKILAERLGVLDPSDLKDLGGVPLAELVARAQVEQAVEVPVAGHGGAVLEVRLSPLFDPDGGRSGAVLLVTDATEERLRQARLAQAEKLSALGQMLAGVAHEINNPLATILGFSEVMLRKAPSEQRPALEAILEEAERCRRIVASLLAFARPRQRERTLLDPGEVAASVLDLLAHELARVPIEVVRQLPPLPHVLADRYELQQVFFNLVQNALQAIKGTGQPGRIVVAGTRHDSPSGARVRVEVRDSGPGLPEGSQGILVPRPFFTTKGEGGTGLGLSIAHGIVRDHGGHIEAGRAPEGGASLAVDLPSARTPAPTPPPPPPPGPPGAPSGQHVLVVDDEDHVRELLGQICRELGYVPVAAANGAEALERVAADAHLAAVLTDIRMPVLDGIGLFRELKARGHPLADRLVFLSGDLARVETANFLREAGRPVLPKPFRFAQVCRVLADVLEPA